MMQHKTAGEDRPHWRAPLDPDDTLMTPAMFMVSALERPISRNTDMLRAAVIQSRADSCTNGALHLNHQANYRLADQAQREGGEVGMESKTCRGSSSDGVHRWRHVRGGGRLYI